MSIPGNGGHVCVVAARVWCAPEQDTRRREKDVRDSGEFDEDDTGKRC